MTRQTAIKPAAQSSVDRAEVAKFSAMAGEWWDPDGKFRTLHKFNPVRLAFIRETLCRHFQRGERDLRPFGDLRILDIGCGGGLLCEPMARLGAEIVGADASEKNIRIADVHAAEMGLGIDYRATTAEDLARSGESFDVILNMEVVEHVADADAFISSCASMVRPGGLMIVATLNRTLKAFALAIVGAEYVLGWLPRGTHQWEKFVTPAEAKQAMTGSGLEVLQEIGVVFNPLGDAWRLSQDTDVNYMMVAQRPATDR